MSSASSSRLSASVRVPAAPAGQAPAGRRPPRLRGLPVAGTRFANRALDALAKSVLCFATVHVLILVVEAVIRRDASGLNVFTMLEAQRLWPALALGPAGQWASLAFALAVYVLVFATLARRATPAVRVPGPIGRRLFSAAAPAVPAALSRPGSNGVSHNGVHAGGASRLAMLAPPRAGLSPVAGWLALVAGLALHMAALASIEQLVPAFPPVPDVVHSRLPYVDFGPPGEMAYALFMTAMILVLLRRQAKTVPVILVMLGVFYAVRGVFLFLLPIGIPPTAPALAERFVFWPFAGHAYFPGGHTGMMTVLSLSVASRPWRRAFLAVTCAFALGTLLARTHYAADAFGGWLVGYAIILWGRRRFGALAGGIPAGREAFRPPAARQECEV